MKIDEENVTSNKKKKNKNKGVEREKNDNVINRRVNPKLDSCSKRDMRDPPKALV